MLAFVPEPEPPCALVRFSIGPRCGSEKKVPPGWLESSPPVSTASPAGGAEAEGVRASTAFDAGSDDVCAADANPEDKAILPDDEAGFIREVPAVCKACILP